MVSHNKQQKSDKLNQNNIVRENKIQAIKEAINYLHQNGVTNITKKMVSEITRRLNPDNKDLHIHHNTLSIDPFYKENYPRWIAEVVGTSNGSHLEKARMEAVKAKRNTVILNRKVVNKACKQIIQSIKNGKGKYKKLTATAVVHWIEENEGKSLSTASISTTYRDILEDYKLQLNESVTLNNSNAPITIEDFYKLQKEIEQIREYKRLYYNLLNGMFVASDGVHSRLTIYGNNVNGEGVKLSGSKILQYINDIAYMLPNQIFEKEAFIDKFISKVSV